MEEYTIERLKRTVCEYEFCKCACFYKMAMLDEFINKQLWDNLWDELNEIDEDFIPVLIELNEKGYYTNSCCSGHLEDIEKYGTWQIYLSFEDEYDLKDIPLEKNKNEIYDLKYKGNKNATIQEKNEDRLKVLEKLLEWAKRLPECEKKSDYKIKDGIVMFGDEEIYRIDWV